MRTRYPLRDTSVPRPFSMQAEVRKPRNAARRSVLPPHHLVTIKARDKGPSKPRFPRPSKVPHPAVKESKHGLARSDASTFIKGADHPKYIPHQRGGSALE